MSTSTSPTRFFLRDAISESPKTQREIAREIGLPNANALSMMKSGECKVPISRIPALSKALNVDCELFLKIALCEYHPEIWMVIEDLIRHRFTEFEQELLGTYAFHCDGYDLQWNEPLQIALNGVFKMAVAQHVAETGKTAAVPADEDNL